MLNGISWQHGCVDYARDPTGWFDRLYAEAAGGDAVIPWQRGAPHRHLAAWAEARALQGAERRAVVVGCGLGDDAEYIAGFGFDTLAFDISPTAIGMARQLHPDSPVRYVTADLLDPPPAWLGTFDLVVECITVQALPDPPRAAAIANVGSLVAPGGTLLVIAFADDGTRPARDKAGGRGGPPWPLSRAEIDSFAVAGLVPAQVELVRDSGAHWVAEFSRPDD